jgi:GT2 family glycosyltransferase
MDAQESVSVVIPTYNRSSMLRRVLPSYLKCTAVAEIIIVDDAGSDDTGDCLRSMASAEPRLRYVRNQSNLGLPASRNRGVELTTGSWILVTEDDLALGENCLETLLGHAELARADVIAGRRIWVRIGESDSAGLERVGRGPRWLLNERLMEHNSQATAKDDVTTPLLNATMLIRREVFERVRFFPAYGGQSSWREDSDFQISALEAGFLLVFCPHAVSFHYSRASQSFGRSRLKGTAVYAYRVFKNNLMFLRRHRGYLRAHYPKALLLGSPELSALMYGIYRTAWLLAAETLRAYRAKRHDAPAWK